MIPDWRVIKGPELLPAVEAYLRGVRPFDLDPVIRHPHDDGIHVEWCLDGSQCIAGISVVKVAVEFPTSSMRLSVNVFWNRGSRSPAAARGCLAVQAQIVDVACVLETSLAGHYWRSAGRHWSEETL